MIRLFECLAGGLLAAVTALTFVSVVLRYVFNWPIPDSFDFGRLLLGIVVFWGMAAASHADEHISMDLLWASLAPRPQRIVDLVATAIAAGAMAVLAWQVFVKVGSSFASAEQTMDIRLAIWPFHAIAAIGLAVAAFFLLRRLVQQLRNAG